MPHILNKKILVSILMLISLMMGSVVFVQHSLAATKPAPTIKVMGKAKFVLKGTVGATTVDSLTLHVTNTSKNSKLFDSKDKTITAGKTTKITKNGRIITFKEINTGDTVKVFGIFDKKSGAITVVRWIKVLSRVSSGQVEPAGTLAGKVSVGPICPVERVGSPCPVPPEAYTSRVFLVLTDDQKKTVSRFHADTQGNYSISLPPGTYVVVSAKMGIGFLSKDLPLTVKIQVGQTTTLNINVDTGIR